jgi:hypothetical protein
MYGAIPTMASLTADQYRAMLKKPRSKYGNQKVVVGGVAYDSKKESRVVTELRLLLARGEIKGLQMQVRFPIIVNGQRICTYVADAVYEDLDGTRHVVDVKSAFTRKDRVYRLKFKMMKIINGIEIEER